MELIVETSLRILCVHGFNDSHLTSESPQTWCIPGDFVNSHMIDTETGDDDDLLNWLGDALQQLESREADLIQIMARRM